MSRIKTSETSPIRVDFVTDRPLGMTFAPGKQGASVLGGFMWHRDLRMDLERLHGHYQVSRIVTLVEEHELELLKIPDLRDAVGAGGMTSHWFPIVDGAVPDDMTAFMALVREIRSSMRDGERVVVHCRGGLGRAGTVAACVLVSLGEDAETAMTLVRSARPGAIENARQEDFVGRFAGIWSDATK